MRRRWLVIAVILTAAQGCDNVGWGGIDVHMQSPPPRDSVNPPASDIEQEAPSSPRFDLPSGAFLLAGSRSGDRATLTVAGEIRLDGLVGFPAEDDNPGYIQHFAETLLPPGSEFVLFSEGVRVGTLLADSAGVDRSFCVPRPTVSGTIELVPGAVEATHYLALPSAWAGGRAYGEFESLSHNYEQRVASIRLASEAIPRVGASWPPSVLDTRVDMQAFRFGHDAQPAIAATFLFRDRLRVEDAPDAAYSLFIIGEMSGQAYRASYVWYRRVGTDTKGAPRFIDHLDLNGDGQPEVLLEVTGSESRWFATLARRNGAWTTAFQERCGQTTPSP